MGQEISRTRFSPRDYAEFQDRLAAETRRLAAVARRGELDGAHRRIGFELEAWLLDHGGWPTPVNEAFIARLSDPWVVRELSRFNVELNSPPIALEPGALAAMEAMLSRTLRHCQEVAHGMDASLALVGILPQLRPEDMCLANMSALKRYAALNLGVQHLRRNEPVHIHIVGEDVLEMDRQDVMLEAATTSFQLHLQVPFGEVGRQYNAALIACGPLLAAGANSPLLFGRRLWQETRIPLFEQSVEVGGYGGLADPDVRRAGFGQGYVGGDITELFRENQALHPVMLPILQEESEERFPHLRLHNGTIWRWVRPLVGFDDSGRPHVRLEQRVLPSGPTVLDMMANAALYLGLSHALARQADVPEEALGFPGARNNFYAAARHGLKAELTWLDGRSYPARDLIIGTLLPVARRGLEDFCLDAAEIARYLDILEQRVRSGQTGAAWQLRALARAGGDVRRMMADYVENQRTGIPVHEWD